MFHILMISYEFDIRYMVRKRYLSDASYIATVAYGHIERPRIAV